jgi:hypothetical protein
MLDLPKGWTYTVETLEEQYNLKTEDNIAYVIQVCVRGFFPGYVVILIKVTLFLRNNQLESYFGFLNTQIGTKCPGFCTQLSLNYPKQILIGLEPQSYALLH